MSALQVVNTQGIRAHKLVCCISAGCDWALSWGRGEDGQLGHGDAKERTKPFAIAHLKGEGLSAVVAGAEYSVALSQTRHMVYSWGW